MWIFVQDSGSLQRAGKTAGMGYSGAEPDGKNNPAMQSVPDAGPIPCGYYTIGAPFDSPKHGLFCLRLTPSPKNNMFGRSGFLMHGDNIAHPGTASEGCIIMPRPVREAVWQSGDRTLLVVERNF